MAKNKHLAAVQNKLLDWILANHKTGQRPDAQWHAHVDAWFELDKIINPQNYLKEQKFLQSFLQFKP
jgi:hypothetical protein